MGKSRPKRRTKDRTNFVSKPPADPELATIREQRILPVLKDLQSPELKTRSTAASVITNIIEDAKCRKLLLREQLVKILLEQTLTDSQLEARTAGWGILRNLAIEEEADFCVHLYRQDILTAIHGVIKSTVSTIDSKNTPFSKLPRAQQKFTWDLVSSAVGLISSLSDAVDEVVQAVTNAPLVIDFFFDLLTYEFTPKDLQNEVLLCLMNLTEDNKPFAQLIVKKAAWLRALQQYMDWPSLNLNAVTACGALHNVFSTMQWFEHNTPIGGASDASLIPVLVHALDATSAESNGMDEESPKTSDAERALLLALEIIASISTDLQEALEHGSKYEEEFEGFDDKPLVNGEDDKMADDEVEGEDEDEDDMVRENSNGEMCQDQIDADMDLVTGDEPESDDRRKVEVTLDRLVRVVTPKVLLLAKEASGDSEQTAIRSHALSALNNIAWTISSLDFSQDHLGALHEFWSDVAQQIWNQVVTPVLASNTADIELASSITSLAWAVSRSVKGFLNIQAGEQRKFMALYQASKGLDSTRGAASSNGTSKQSRSNKDVFQGLGVKSVGVLGSLALDPAPIELNKEVGIFLITVIASLPDRPAPDAVEALNQIFDIYADGSYACDEAVYWKGGFHKHLEDIVPKVKMMAKSIDKRINGELRSRADEALLNLGRFLKYKKMEKEQKSVCWACGVMTTVRNYVGKRTRVAE